MYSSHDLFNSEFPSKQTYQTYQTSLHWISIYQFLAPTGALEEGILSVRVSVRDIIQKSIENKF